MLAVGRVHGAGRPDLQRMCTGAVCDAKLQLMGLPRD